MGKPAARATDTANTCNDPTDMPVGKVIAVGTVFINKLPAAKQGDQVVGVDTHIIMIPTPGGPVPTPLPHPFAGMLDNGLSSSVKIMGMPAATVDSMASNMPPHIPQGGPFQKPPTNKAKIIMGSANVFIGNGGGGGGSGKGGGKKKAKATAQAADSVESHTLNVKFEDKGGKPVTGAKYLVKGPDGKESEGFLAGQVERQGVAEGSHEIKLSAVTKASWSTDRAEVGDKVKLQVETTGVESGEKAVLRIFIKDSNFADYLFETIETEVGSDKIEEEWELKVDEKLTEAQDKKEDKNYSSPSYYFVVEVAGLKQRSGSLIFKDWLELELADDEGKPIAKAAYKVYLPDGSIRSGNLDDNGYAKIEKVPPGNVKVEYDIRSSEK